jgi:nicotinate-nucleotide--dimethylbenzimidazole phosphoribosyltransferase
MLPIRPAAAQRVVARTRERIGPLDDGATVAARERQARLTKPAGSLGRLEELAVKLAGITGRPQPSIAERLIVVCAADHGVTAQGVSAYPSAVTAQMVYNFIRGGAAINVLARRIGARVLVADLGVDHDFPPGLPLVRAKLARGTADLSRGPAMSRDQAVRAVAAGIRLAGQAGSSATGVGRAAGCTVVGTGDMGIGNTTAASAIVAAMTGAPVRDVTGRGTGIDQATWERKVAVIERALAVNRPHPADPLGVLAKIGGFEIGAIAGVILGSAARRCPVVVDGFISGAAALLAAALCPPVRDYLIPGHASVEIGHRLVLEQLELAPLLALNFRLGEGTGAAVAMHLLDDALAILREMATFEEAGVAERLPEGDGGTTGRQARRDRSLP